MDYAKIGKIEAIALVCIGIVNHTVLNMPKNIIESCGSSSLLNILYLIVLISLFAFILIKCFKPFSGSDIIDISEYLAGKPLKFLMGTLYIVLFLLMSGIILRSFSEGLQLVYFSTAPISIILLAFLVVVAIAGCFSNKSIINCNFIIVLLMLISLAITFCTLSPEFTYQRMFPLLGNGINETFLSGTGNIYALSGICLLFFLPPMLKEKNHYPKIAIASIAISSFLLFLSILSLLFALPFTFNVDELSPIYLLVRASQFGSFLKRPESIFILIWILSIMSFISIFTMFSRIILQKLFALKDARGMNLWFVQLLFLIALLPKNMSQTTFIENTVYKYLSIGIIFFFSFVVLLLAYRKKKKQNKQKEETILNE